MRARRYFQFVEKEEGQISRIWMILHLFLFLVTAINSGISAFAFGEIYDIFNYRCVLYAKPYFHLDEFASKDELGNKFPVIPRFLPDLSDYTLIPGTKNYYIIDDEVFFINETLVGRVAVKMRKSVFSTLMMCNLAMFIPLLSLIVSCSFLVFVLLCGRGGRKSNSEVVTSAWLYVFPLLIASVTMTVLTVIAANTVNSGLESFCARFEKYTNTRRCSPLMDYFTKQQKAGRRFFWSSVSQCHITFTLDCVFWIGQIVVVVLRILTSADFELNMVEMKSKVEESEFDEEESLWDMQRNAKLYETVIQLKRSAGYEKNDT